MSSKKGALHFPGNRLGYIFLNLINSLDIYDSSALGKFGLWMLERQAYTSYRFWLVRLVFSQR